MIKAAATDPEVERVLVNAAIKEGGCAATPATIAPGCKKCALLGARLPHACAHRLPGRQSWPNAATQDAVAPGEAARKDLADWWFSGRRCCTEAAMPKPPVPPKPKPLMMLSDMPDARRQGCWGGEGPAGPARSLASPRTSGVRPPHAPG